MDISKEKKEQLLKEIVSKKYPNEGFLFNEPKFLIKDSQKRFGFSKTGFRVFYNKQIFLSISSSVKQFLSPKVIKDIISKGKFGNIKSSDFQDSDFETLKMLYDIYDTYFNSLESELNKKYEKLEKERLSKLNTSKNNILSQFDNDGDGKVDFIKGGDDYLTLLKNYQKKIIEIDRTYIQQFIRVSNYLTQKKQNTQIIFERLSDSRNEEQLNELVDILKQEIHTYNIILLNSLHLINSLIDDDMITFYDIFEKFDKLNMFNSNWENQVTNKLNEVNLNLVELMNEIRDMGDSIVSSIDDLSYVTLESTRILDNRLGELNSSLNTNNLLTLINTYQSYQTNQNTKSLKK